MADISVIIPARDRLWSLPKAVSSCRSSRLDIQIIVIDDSSTDGTSEWLQQQSDITALKGEGWGKPWGINRALPMVTGTYLRFLDADDWLSPGANERQHDLAERDKADLVVAGFDIYRDEMFSEPKDWIPTDDFIAQQLGEAPGSHYSAFLFRTDFARHIPHRTLFPAADFASRDDRCFILEVALRHPRVSVCRERTLCHRHHDRQRLQFHTALRGAGTNIQHLYIYRQILRLLEDRGELTERRKRAAVKMLWPLAHWVAYHDLKEAKEIALWIQELDPGFSPPERGLLGLLYKKAGFSATEKLLRFRRQLVAMMRPLKAAD